MGYNNYLLCYVTMLCYYVIESNKYLFTYKKKNTLLLNIAGVCWILPWIQEIGGFFCQFPVFTEAFSSLPVCLQLSFSQFFVILLARRWRTDWSPPAFATSKVTSHVTPALARSQGWRAGLRWPHWWQTQCWVVLVSWRHTRLGGSGGGGHGVGGGGRGGGGDGAVAC